VLECPFTTAYNPILDYSRCPTALPASPDTTSGASFRHLSRTKNSTFARKNGTYGHSTDARCKDSPKALVTIYGLYQAKSQQNSRLHDR